MNLTPANWKKSEVTEYKDYVKAGMRLFSPASGACKVLEVETDNMLVHFEDDDAGEFDEWFNMNDLQLSWSFSRKDKEFIELIASTKNTKDFNPATMTRATKADIDRIWRELWGDATVLYILGRFDTESGEYLDLTQK